MTYFCSGICFEEFRIAMELCQENLSQFIHKSERSDISYELFISWIAQIASGMEYLHSWHITHRDLKPQKFVKKEKWTS
jgi:serine/threonine protein kinase